MIEQKQSYSSLFTQLSALLLIISGGLFVLFNLVLGDFYADNISAAAFLDTVPIPFDWVQIGPISFPLQVDNYLIFQEFKSFAPAFRITESLLFAALIWLVAVSALAMMTKFNKTYFIIGGVAWILVLTVSNFNGLNIGGQSSNLPLIIILCGSIIPPILIHIWGVNLKFWMRWFAVLVGTFISLVAVISLSPIEQPELYLAEHSLLLGFIMAMGWIFWNGHSFLSGIYILLAKASRDLNHRISIQISVIALIYLAAVFFILLDTMGETNLPFPTFSPFYLIFPLGILGWFSIREKILQVPELIGSPAVVKYSTC